MHEGVLRRDAARAGVSKIEEADAVIFGSPVYFGSMTAQLKAFFDKTRDVRGRRAWVGIPAAAVSVGASKYGGQEIND